MLIVVGLHDYVMAGTHTVTLTLTDSAGVSGALTRPITVDPPLAAYTVPGAQWPDHRPGSGPAAESCKPALLPPVSEHYRE